jgi:hypothetical protein
MARYRVVCTNQEPASELPQHAQIVAVGVSEHPKKASKRLLLSEVLQMMDRGDQFYTKGVESGKEAGVVKFHCDHCSKTHIRSTPIVPP